MADMRAYGRGDTPQGGAVSGTYDSDHTTGARRAAAIRVIRGGGIVLSLATVVGLCVWGTRAVQRDAQGVPLVKAQPGEMRERPETPGGQPAAHQGLAVNAVAALGIADPAADRVTLAPRPLTLSDDDLAQAMLPATPIRAATPGVTPARAAPDTQQSPNNMAQQDTPLPTDSAVDQLAASLVASAVPLTPVAPVAAAPTPAEKPAPETAQAQSEPEITKPARQITGGIARSLRPQLRPKFAKRAVAASAKPADAVVAAVARATGTAAPIPAAAEAGSDVVAPGTRLAQLGAFESPEIAGQEWERLSARFSEFIEDKTRVIQRAKSGGKTFYRLRAMGFADISDARRFCAAFVAENVECIPVVSK